MRTLTLLVLLGVATTAIRANAPIPEAKERVLTNKAGDIHLVSTADENVRDFFRGHHIIVGFVRLKKEVGPNEGNLTDILVADKPVEKVFVHYASRNDDPEQSATFGMVVTIAPPSPAVIELMKKRKAVEQEQDLTLILREDEAKPGLWHIAGYTGRTAVGFFDSDAKNKDDGFSQKDLCFAVKGKK